MTLAVEFTGSAASVGSRSIIALIETGVCQLATRPHGVSPVLLRVGGLFSRAARVVLCPWHQVLLTKDAAKITGPVLAIDGNQYEVESIQGSLPVNAMWFYPVTDSTPVGETESERIALTRLVSMGSRPTTTRSTLCALLLSEAAGRGVVTNSAGPLGRWGRKDHLEYALRWYERVSGRRIPRPRTFPVSGAQLEGALDYFARHGSASILKPANKARGEGVRVMPVQAVACPDVSYDQQFVVQELVKDPLLIDGFKTDLRVYVLVDSANGSSSRRLTPILVRTASARHAEAGDRAEITNTSYRRRHGLPVLIAPLDNCPGISAHEAQSITASVDVLTNELLNAVRTWGVAHGQSHDCEWRSRRVMIWGLDIVLTTAPVVSKQPLLLEVNVYPQLYRGDATCDALIDEMLLEDYLPTYCRRDALAHVAGPEAAP